MTEPALCRPNDLTPTNRAGWLRRDVVDDAVHAAHLAHDADRGRPARDLRAQIQRRVRARNARYSSPNFRSR
jgi:hypothetical protein